MNAGCTIVSPNYLPYARTLAASYLQHHPDHLFFVLIVADVKDKGVFAAEQFTTVLLQDLGLDNLYSLAMKYNILELNTNVKPSFLNFLLRAYPSLETLVYLDPDIFVYARLEPVYTLLKSNNIVLTPHIVVPTLEPFLDIEQSILVTGTYNLGFIAIRRSQEAAAMLSWWEIRCLQLAYNETRTGLFVDQKWVTLVPGIFEHVAICRHPGCNMAYWNLQERKLQIGDIGYRVNEAYNLYFYHFSGVSVDDPKSLTKYTERFTLDNRNDLIDIFTSYKALVSNNRDSLADRIPYGFDHFSDGSEVTPLARRIFAAHEGRFSGKDPFDPAGPFYRFAKRRRLVGGKNYRGPTRWREVNQKDFRIRILNSVFLAALFVLGPSRYELLMRYLSHFSILRSQKLFIK